MVYEKGVLHFVQHNLRLSFAACSSTSAARATAENRRPTCCRDQGRVQKRALRKSAGAEESLKCLPGQAGPMGLDTRAGRAGGDGYPGRPGMTDSGWV